MTLSKYETMVEMIHNHGHEAVLLSENTGIRVKDVWTYDDKDGNRQIGEEWNVIKASWLSVRDWLGY